MELWTNWLYQTGWKVFTIAGFCLGTFFMIRRLAPLAIRRTVKRQMKRKRKVEREKRVQTLVRVVTTTSAIGLGTLATILILIQVGVNIYAGIAALGIVGVAVGFGAQHVIHDVINGFFTYLENQYNVGDVIRVGNIAGIVEELSLRRTVLRDLDGARHVIPNGEIRTVSNLTQEWSRAHVNISVAYKEDLDRVMALMKKTWEGMAEDPNWGPSIISKTPTILRVNEFENSGITIKMVGETEPLKQWDVMAEYKRRIKRVFDKEDIEIPWPHIKLYHGDATSSRREV